MCEVRMQRDRLLFSFPEVDPEANMWITFQRTLRIPDDGREYPLPPGLGSFPLARVDDHAATAPQSWRRHGGVMLPMYQSEAMWLFFRCDARSHGRADSDPKRQRYFGFNYPIAIKVACGKVCAVTGKEWSDGLNGERNPDGDHRLRRTRQSRQEEMKQNYLVAPCQPWLDGFCVKRGQIRQFVAMPLGSGYSVEEQVTGEAEWGGVQIEAFPMKREYAERLRRTHDTMLTASIAGIAVHDAPVSMDMGLAPGGRMKQEIYEDPYGLDAWDTAHSARCFVHLCNSLVWRQITGANPPHPPTTAEEYARWGLPWFDWYDADAKALDGSETLANVKSVAEMAKEKGDAPMPENDSIIPEPVVELGPSKVVRSWFERRSNEP